MDKNEFADHHASPAASENSMGQDEAEMAKMGKKQQLRRNFRFFSILGFSCIIMVTWEGVLATFVYGLENGGPGGLIVGFFWVWVGFALVIASLGELMSMWPTSGGQYHWSYTLASPRWAAFLSYLCGWQSLIAWQAITASAAYLTATMIQGLVVLNYPDYDFKRWHGTLIMYALMLFALMVNTLLARLLPMIENVMLGIHVLGFIATVAVITAMAPEKASAHDVFQVFLNEGGWPSDGIAWWVGIQGLIFAFLGADGAIHMSEEIKNASTVLPWSLLGSILINGLMGFAVLVALLFCMGDIQTALSSPTGYPFEEAFRYATGSNAGATGLAAIVIALAVLATTTQLTAGSRELWAFARDNGVPGSGILKRVHPKSKLPLWSIACNMVIVLLLALINIGSSIAFNAVLSVTVAGFLGSYIIPLCLVLYRRVQAFRGVGKELPWGPWKLGTKTGIVVNTLTLLWSILSMFWSFWPTATPTTAAGMNWSCLIYGTVDLFALVFWLVAGHKTYKGPVRDVDGAIESVRGWSEEVEADRR